MDPASEVVRIEDCYSLMTDQMPLGERPMVLLVVLLAQMVPPSPEALAMVRSLHRWWGEAIERLFDDQVAVPLNG
jgi:hypothetical protein